MRQVNLYQAKTHLSQLVDEAASGTEIIIAKAGKPMVRLVPIEPARAHRPRGLARGQFHVGPDFDAPLPEDMLAPYQAGTP